MTARNPLERLFTYAGVITWAVVAAIALFAARNYPLPRLALAGALILALLVTMLSCGGGNTGAGRSRTAAFWAHGFTAYALGMTLPFEFIQIYTIIWIAMAPAFFTARGSLVLLAAIVLAWLAVSLTVWDDRGGWMSILLFGTFHLFALLSSLTATEAERSHAEALQLNRELIATRHLLAQTTRESERTRIARDLHDLIGHHLTALSIHLQVAARQADGDTKARIDKCHSISRLLLADVRAAVSELRGGASFDFAEAVREMAGQTPGLDVRVDIGSELRITDVAAAEALLRSIQEAITNTLRHANASRLDVRIRADGTSLDVVIDDDGRARGDIVPGNGLTGMRERIERCGGEMDLTSETGPVRISIRMPGVAIAT